MMHYLNAADAIRKDDAPYLKRVLAARDQYGYRAIPIDGLFHGYTLLHIAAMNGSVRCIKALLEEHADPNLYDAHGCRPAYYLCISRNEHRTKEALAELWKGGANLEDNIISNSPCVSAISVAESTGNSELAKAIESLSTKYASKGRFR